MPQRAAASSRCAHGATAIRLLLFGAASVLLATGCGTSHVDAVGHTGADPGAGGPSGSSSSYVYRVTSGSMEPTLRIGSRVVVRAGPPAVGAVVVYHPPEGFATQECGPTPHVVKPGAAACAVSLPDASSIRLIKRVVAGPGDEIYIRAGHVYRRAAGSDRFVREEDSYIRACGGGPACDFPDPIKIAAGSWFLMGDNRRESNDSRFWGPVPTAWILGVASVPAGGGYSSAAVRRA